MLTSYDKNWISRLRQANKQTHEGRHEAYLDQIRWCTNRLNLASTTSSVMQRTTTGSVQINNSTEWRNKLTNAKRNEKIRRKVIECLASAEPPNKKAGHRRPGRSLCHAPNSNCTQNFNFCGLDLPRNFDFNGGVTKISLRKFADAENRKGVLLLPSRVSPSAVPSNTLSIVHYSREASKVMKNPLASHSNRRGQRIRVPSRNIDGLCVRPSSMLVVVWFNIGSNINHA